MSWTHLSDKEPKARKRYRCQGCWEFIEIGEKHLHRTGVMDGTMVSARWHPECEEYAFSDGNDEYESPPGCFCRAEALALISPPATEHPTSPEATQPGASVSETNVHPKVAEQ